MDKDQIAAKLAEMGYKSVLENGVVMCTLESEKTTRELKKVLKELSYNGSWGYRIRKGVKNEAETVCSGENSSEVSDGGGSARDVVLPHEELSEYSGIREHREQAESNGSLQDDESEQGNIEWRDCTTIFSNGTEFEIFQFQCEKCTRYRNGKCRVFTKCIEAMFDETKFPYKDLLDASGGYGGKKCKSFTDEPIKRNRNVKTVDGQISIMDLLG